MKRTGNKEEKCREEGPVAVRCKPVREHHNRTLYATLTGSKSILGFREADGVTSGGIFKLMGTEALASARLLLIDSCGDPACVVLSEGERVHLAETLPRRRASAEMVGAIRRLLTEAGWQLAELQGIGVVSGPGSFTGVRTGLSVAKGLSEAAGLRVFPVSRLAVLAQKSDEGFVALDAGRNAVYVRDLRGACESLLSDAALLERAAGSRVVIAEESLRERLASLQPELHQLETGLALPFVLEQLAAGGGDVALLDANYLCEEKGIYKHADSVAKVESL